MTLTLLISIELFVMKSPSTLSYLVGSVTICVTFWSINMSAKSLYRLRYLQFCFDVGMLIYRNEFYFFVDSIDV